MSWHFLCAEQITAEEIARAESPITHLAALQLADSPLDLLLCAGHFKALSVYRHGKVCMCVCACFLSVRQPFCTGHFEALMLCVCACFLSVRQPFCAGYFEALTVLVLCSVCVPVFCLVGDCFILVTLKL